MFDVCFVRSYYISREHDLPAQRMGSAAGGHGETRRAAEPRFSGAYPRAVQPRPSAGAGVGRVYHTLPAIWHNTIIFFISPYAQVEKVFAQVKSTILYSRARRPWQISKLLA